MDAKQEPPSDLKHFIHRDLEGYRALLELLDLEKQLLIKRNFDEFAAVLERKHNLLAELDQSTAQRLQLLSASGLSQDEAGMQTLFEGQPEFGRDQLKADWHQIKQLVHQCNRQNEVNAKIAHRAQSTSRQILNILRGAPTTGDLYDRHGTNSDAGKGLTITRA